MSIREPRGKAARHTDVTETLVAETVMGSIAAEQDSEAAVCELYSANYQSLVRLAAILVRDAATAEEVVQDAFVAMHGAWMRLRDTDKALSYLRQSVVNRSRSVLRHRAVVDKYAPKPAPDAPSAEQGAISLLERSAVIAALRGLPARQREALVLRYYADLSEAQIANAMGISRGAVKSHTARGMSALRTRAGAGVMTDPEAEYGERLRRALHAAADGVVPSGDGLERIRSRIAHEPARDRLRLAPRLAEVPRSGRQVQHAGRAVCPSRAEVSPAADRISRRWSSPRPPSCARVGQVRGAADVALPLISPRCAGQVHAAADQVGGGRVGSIFVTLRSHVPERLRVSDGWLRPVIATAGAVFVAVIADDPRRTWLAARRHGQLWLDQPKYPEQPAGGSARNGRAARGHAGSATPPASTQLRREQHPYDPVPAWEAHAGGHSPVAKQPDSMPDEELGARTDTPTLTRPRLSTSSPTPTPTTTPDRPHRPRTRRPDAEPEPDRLLAGHRQLDRHDDAEHGIERNDDADRAGERNDDADRGSAT